MRIRHLTNILLSALLCSTAFAGSFMSEHRMAVSVDPISWTAGNFNLQYELSINDRVSFNMPIRFGFDKAVFTNNYFNGGYALPKIGVKYYVTGKATEQGFYVNPLLGLFIGKANGSTDTTSGLTYGFRFGYAVNMWKGFWLDSFLSYEAVATQFNSDKIGGSNAAIIPGDINGFLANKLGTTGFNVGLLLGYAF